MTIEHRRAVRVRPGKRRMRLVRREDRSSRLSSCFSEEDARKALYGARDLSDLIERIVDCVIERAGAPESRELLRFLVETDPGLLEELGRELAVVRKGGWRSP